MYNPFNGLVQLILWGLMTSLFVVMFIGQIIMCGHFEWWQLIMGVLLIILLAGLHIVWREYKDEKEFMD